MGSSLALCGAVLLDALLGDPRRYHPLSGYGRVAAWLEQRVNHGGRWPGVIVACVWSLLPAAILTAFVQWLPAGWDWVIAGIFAALCLGRRSLQEHVQAVADALAADDLFHARRRVSFLVSRETDGMDPTAVRRAAIESLLENASDAVFASLFWFVVGGMLFGPAGAVFLIVWHRLVNTLDAMWGYHNARFEHFGWGAAKLDDLLNWLPARATGLTFALVGRWRPALACWHRQAPDCPSPNAGVTMSAGAGALGILLGGGARYHGQWEDRPWLGYGPAPTADSVTRAMALINRSLILWLIIIVVVNWP